VKDTGPESFKDNLIIGLLISFSLFLITILIYFVVNESYWLSGGALAIVLGIAKVKSIRENIKK
jgi:hypothetical protein